jgi:sortase A
VGTALVVAGAALLGHVAWDMWGTGIGTARAQTQMKSELRQAFAKPKKHHERIVPGGAEGLILIPKIKVDMAFVEGVTPEALAKGPGHYPGTPLPGQGANVAIAGHRTTHLAPFWALDSLEAGDDITLRTREGSFVYRVMWVGVARPNAGWVVAATDLPSLTLTTCWPRFSSTRRLVVRAIQVYGQTPGGFVDHLHQSVEAWTRPPAQLLGQRLA